MSEELATVELQERSQVDLDSMQPEYHVEFPQPLGHGDRLIGADFGTVATPRGDLLVSRLSLTDKPAGEPWDDNNSGKEMEYLEVGRAPLGMVQLDRHFNNGSSTNSDGIPRFLRRLGFSKQTKKQEDGAHEVVLTAPSIDILNTVLNEVYSSTDEQPPFQFVTKDGSRRFIKGDEYVSALAEGKVVMTEPDEALYYHDVEAHLKGWMSLTPEIFSLISDRAKELVTAGKLTTDESGSLIDPEARRFVILVDGLTSISDGTGSIDRKEAEALLGRPLTGLSGGVKLGKMKKQSISHTKWVSRRVKEINESDPVLALAA